MVLTAEQFEQLRSLPANERLDLKDEATGEYWAFYKDEDFNQDVDPDDWNMLRTQYFRNEEEFRKEAPCAATEAIHISDLYWDLKENEFLDQDAEPYDFGGNQSMERD